MHTRSQRVVFSMIAVLGAFCAYRLSAVPLIEPGEDPTDPVNFVGGPRPEQSPPEAPQKELFERLFPPGAWQRDNPIVIESDRAMILMHDYKNSPTGEVQLAPCTMIFFPRGDQTIDENLLKRVIVMDAPAGAVLKFDSPVDLRKAKIGKLVGGRLPGKITIRGNPGGYQGRDEIYAETSDLQLKEDEAWTPASVNFRIGPNEGHGRELHIKLQTAPPGAKRGISFSGAEALELRYDVAMHVVPGTTGMLPGDRAAIAGVGARPVPLSPPVEPPIDITCGGKFTHRLTDNVTIFEDRVNVIRQGRAVQADQLTCDRLSIRFAQRSRDAASPSAAEQPQRGSSSGGSLQPIAFEATGHPVILRAPSSGGFVQGQRLEYDVLTGRVTVEAEDKGEMTIKQSASEIHAQKVIYQPGEPGHLGRLASTGPGWLKGASPTNPNQIWEAKWKTELRIQPHEQQHVITLLGKSELKMAETGQLDGDEIYVWLNEIPQAASPPQVESAPLGQPGELGLTPTRMQVAPDRLLARGSVTFDSAAASGGTDRFEVWFKYAPITLTAGAVPLRGASEIPSAPQPPRMTNPFIRNEAGSPPRPSGPAVGTNLAPRGQVTLTPIGSRTGQPEVILNPLVGSLPANRANPPANPQHFEVHGKLIRLQLLSMGPRTLLDDVSIEGDAKLDETQTAQPNDRPLHLEGQQLQVLGAASTKTTATVTGKPAIVRARGLGLSGEKIQLDRAANRLWIDGAGRMLLPLDRGLDGRALPHAMPLEVVWEGKMDFDGLTAHFEQAVDAHTELQSLRTATMDVSLASKLDFQQPAGREAGPQVNTINCQGGVLLESRTFDGPRQVSWERLHVNDLAINQTTGELLAHGPGWVTSYRVPGAEGAGGLPLGAAGPPANRGAAVPLRNPAPAAKAPEDKSLQFLNVQFLREITGNTRQREMTFHDQVRALYGPVKDWNEELNADRVEDLGPRGALLTCNALKLVEMAAQPPARGTVEMEARENVLIEAQGFTARAARASYAQAKELFVLEGDGRDDAQLFRQQTVGGPLAKAVARKILYWRATNRVEMDDARFFDFSQLGGANPLPRGLTNPAPVKPK